MAYIKGKEILFGAQLHEGDTLNVEVVQTTGDSETAVMSQKAVTDELDNTTEALANVDNRLVALYSNGEQTFNPAYIEVTNASYGYSGYSKAKNRCVVRPIKVSKSEKITISGNGLRIHCFIVSESTFDKNNALDNKGILVAITSSYLDNVTYEVKTNGYLVINIKKADDTNISIEEATKIAITRTINKNEATDGLVRIGYGLMTTDGEGKFTTANASHWELHALPIQAGQSYDIIPLSLAIAGSSRVKWAFTSLSYNELETREALNSSNVILHAESITNESVDKKPLGVSVTAPEGAKTLVLCTGIGHCLNCETHIIRYEDNGEEKILPSSALRVNKSNLVKIVGRAKDIGATSAMVNEDGDIVLDGGRYWGICTLVKSKAHTENIILRMTYKVERDATATAFPRLYATYDNHFRSIDFCLDNAEYMEASWRFPAFGFVNEGVNIAMHIPKGCTLYIKDIKSEYSNATYSHETGVRLSAHLGVYDFAPENTMQSFVAARNLGYPSCIANPKITADGVFVCIHDDDISRTATNADGTGVTTGTVLVSQSNYTDLLQYDFGRKYNAVYKGAKIPKLDDFLFYCGKVGMKPVFSCHYDFTTEQYEEIKGMMKRYGVLKSFTYKGSWIGWLTHAYEVFGDEIDGYVYDRSSVSDIDEVISSLDESPLAAIKDKVIIEIAHSVITQEAVTKVVNAGYKAGVFDVFAMKGERYKELIRWGVTEFVDDRNCSYGLNW